MPKIKILSDGTREGTQILLNGEDLTEAHFVTDVHFTAETGDYVTFEYGVREPYVTEKGEAQGTVSTRYRYLNGTWADQPAPTPHLGVGQSESADAIRVGGRILEDASGARKAERLILKSRRVK